MATSITNTSITTNDLVVDGADNVLKVDHNTNRVGIGTSTPTHPLNVYADGPPSGIVAKFQTTGNPWIQNTGAGSSWQTGSTPYGWELFNDDNSDYKVAVKPTGELGIGTREPTTKLDVRGSATIANNQGYFAANLTEINNTAIALRLSPVRAEVTKSIAIGSMGSSNTGTGIQAYDSSDNSANDFQINPFGGRVAIGKTTALTNSALTIGGNWSNSYSSTIYLDNDATGGADGWINTTDDTWTLKTNAGQGGLAIGTGTPQSGTARIHIGNDGLITMGKNVSSHVGTSGDSAAHVHTTGPVSIGHNSDQSEWRKGGRVVKGWYAVGYRDTGSGNYIHINTDLWGGGSAQGNSDYIMGGFEIRGHRYATGSSVAHHFIYFHNWSGNTGSGYSVSSSGNWDASPSAYVNSSGYVTLRVPNASYYGFIIDLHQYNWYPIRNITVTSVQVSSNNV